jgi:hypothetical protein
MAKPLGTRGAIRRENDGLAAIGDSTRPQQDKAGDLEDPALTSVC